MRLCRLGSRPVWEHSQGAKNLRVQRCGDLMLVGPLQVIEQCGARTKQILCHGTSFSWKGSSPLNRCSCSTWISKVLNTRRNSKEDPTHLSVTAAACIDAHGKRLILIILGKALPRDAYLCSGKAITVVEDTKRESQCGYDKRYVRQPRWSAASDVADAVRRAA